VRTPSGGQVGAHPFDALLALRLHLLAALHQLLALLHKRAEDRRALFLDRGDRAQTGEPDPTAAAGDALGDLLRQLHDAVRDVLRQVTEAEDGRVLLGLGAHGRILSIRVV
jgi:hypothetical protein